MPPFFSYVAGVPASVLHGLKTVCWTLLDASLPAHGFSKN
jgi:hypothetical protein